MTSLLDAVTTFNHNRENAQEISHFCYLHSEKCGSDLFTKKKIILKFVISTSCLALLIVSRTVCIFYCQIHKLISIKRIFDDFK